MEPKTIFAILVYDPTRDANPPNLVLQGSEMEVWDSPTCEDRARLLDHEKPGLVLQEVRLAAGMTFDALTLSEESPPRVVVVGALTDKSLYAAGTEEGAFDRTIPSFEVENLVRTLRGSVNLASNENGNQGVRAEA